ncbi:hypothetical protein [Dyadobacter aurulentus]|uniref:hypothetical protein n=1 Tax=Dyadobacter sp. UC 10 TaxID=2605428 RepID=UPI0011F21A0A|nr:hypothetical protein [Dyadobacter sp. UC 10]KAA0993535.1 hypothetical protein FXO21_26830 [Dyadobacter sp. UC 10]
MNLNYFHVCITYFSKRGVGGFLIAAGSAFTIDGLIMKPGADSTVASNSLTRSPTFLRAFRRALP